MEGDEDRFCFRKEVRADRNLIGLSVFEGRSSGEKYVCSLKKNLMIVFVHSPNMDMRPDTHGHGSVDPSPDKDFVAVLLGMCRHDPSGVAVNDLDRNGLVRVARQQRPGSTNWTGLYYLRQKHEADTGKKQAQKTVGTETTHTYVNEPCAKIP